ncbi:MAG TPA: BON domain-containing protein [Vicinamibacterales bacterium]
MSKVCRVMGAFALALLISGAIPAAAQTGAIKDGWLVMKVHSEMVDEDVLSGSDIDVDVKDGVVTLQGTVPSEAARARAIAVAKANDGVKNVVDQLKIAPAKGSNMAAKADRAGDKAERAGEKAADKTVSATKKTGRAIDDGWIKSKIYAQYMADWNTVLNDSDIDVDVANNVVTLNGTVKTAEAKTKAVSIAKATDGVKSVKDNLRVAAGTR